MNAPVQISAELAHTIKAKRWNVPDAAAAAFEQGAVATKPASGLTSRNVIASRYLPRAFRRKFTAEERAKRRQRKRMLGGSSAMPDTLRGYFTEGERSVACIVAGEVKKHGYCDLSIDELADRAGVGRTTVQNYEHEARRLGHIKITYRPQRGAKSLTNVITIISAEWKSWITRAPSAARRIGSEISKNVNTTEIKDLKKEEAWRWESDAPPPDPSPNEESNAF